MKVKLCSIEQSAAKATDKTIQGLPGNAQLSKNAYGDIIFDEDGLAEIIGEYDHGFFAFALVNQGYVKSIY